MAHSEKSHGREQIPLRAVLNSRFRGALYGLAVGDALGAPYEFKRRGSYAVSGEMEKSNTPGRSRMGAGTWTDDTSLALCLAESLNDLGAFNWEDVAKKMVKWYEDGYMSAVGYCFDIGNATRNALSVYSDALHGSTSRLVLSGSSEPSSSGNGSLMRLAPIPVFFHAKPAVALEMSEAQSRVTHASQLCLESCRLATAQMLGFFAFNSDTDTSVEEIQRRKRTVISPTYVPSGVSPDALDFITEEVQALRMGSWKTKTVNEIKTSGFVIHSHEAALWALWSSSSFEEGMLKLLPLGSDVDTVCAIYGQLAGALYGVEAIPARWLEALQKRDVLESVFGKLTENALA
ncbi:ADP-ribosylglycohydrolase [Phellopilus nigrolimitatus]|nr:ADP-ribosylglycohydrolase [Phellopilus nigrolimitatus]